MLRPWRRAVGMPGRQHGGPVNGYADSQVTDSRSDERQLDDHVEV